ncbi:hypothetical protein HMPREF3099_11340 [Kytococcus sp. HMSC28H12]|nr:hypothetical protein HMPREF3099_11340 [Kytococcus sp. HMSC28H12]
MPEASLRVGCADLTIRRGRWPRRITVVEDLSWSIPTDGRSLLIGANGAGKSSLVQALVGLIRPSAGEIRRPVQVAYVPQATQVLRGVTVGQQVEYISWLAGRSARQAPHAAAEALATVGLAELASRPSRELSGGQARRMALAEALASPGEFLVLDEPTVGLDPVQRASFHEALAATGRPHLMTTHLLDAVTDEVDRVSVMDAGRIVFDGTPAEFLGGADRRMSPDEAFVHHVGAGSTARRGLDAVPEGVTLVEDDSA